MNICHNSQLMNFRYIYFFFDSISSQLEADQYLFWCDTTGNVIIIENRINVFFFSVKVRSGHCSLSKQWWNWTGMPSIFNWPHSNATRKLIGNAKMIIFFRIGHKRDSLSIRIRVFRICLCAFFFWLQPSRCLNGNSMLWDNIIYFDQNVNSMWLLPMNIVCIMHMRWIFYSWILINFLCGMSSSLNRLKVK